jgi:predicted metalloprotease with PDZ domain
MRGDWKFSDEEFFGLVEKIVRAQRSFWNDHDFPYYLITLIPTGEQCCSYGGTGLTNSFATFISTNTGIDLRMKYLLAHELLHTWIGQKISITDTPDQPEALLYWFSEGFTDYYTRELLLRAGLITLDEYIADYNKKIYDYYVSPARNAPNARVPQEFWKDRFVGKLPYQRGDLLAHRWNAGIKTAHEERFSLDDMMRYILGLTKTSGLVVSDTALNRVIQPYLTQEILGDLRKYIEKGETIPLDANALGPEVRLKEVAMGPFDLGFDFDASHAQRRITGVQKNGPAFKAGLRNGQLLKGMSIYWNDPAKEVEFKIEDNGGEKKIRYLPVGKKSKIPQYCRIGE